MKIIILITALLLGSVSYSQVTRQQIVDIIQEDGYNISNLNKLYVAYDPDRGYSDMFEIGSTRVKVEYSSGMPVYKESAATTQSITFLNEGIKIKQTTPAVSPSNANPSIGVFYYPYDLIKRYNVSKSGNGKIMLRLIIE